MLLLINLILFIAINKAYISHTGIVYLTINTHMSTFLHERVLIMIYTYIRVIFISAYKIIYFVVYIRTYSNNYTEFIDVISYI